MNNEFKIEKKKVVLEIPALKIKKAFKMPLQTKGETRDLQISDYQKYSEIDKERTALLLKTMKEVGFNYFSYQYFNATSFEVKKGILELGIKSTSEFNGQPLYEINKDFASGLDVDIKVLL